MTASAANTPPIPPTLANRRMFLFLFFLSVASWIGMQGWNTLFNNFAVESAGLSGLEIGLIQSAREIPGFLALLAAYLLLVVAEHRLAALSIVILGAGLAATGFFPSFWGVVLTTVAMSFGFHYFETCNQSLTLQYFPVREAPVILGRLRSAGAVTNIVVGVAIFFLAGKADFASMYLALGLAVAAIGLWGLTRNPTDPLAPMQNTGMVLRRKYWVYYVLTFLAGARRQILMAFAGYLLVRKFGMSVREITVLFILNNAVNAVLSRKIGHVINRFGEQTVLRLEYVSVIVVFLTYGFSDSRELVTAFFVLDQLTINFGVCLGTYFQKIADAPDIAPTMAVGFTINHIAAVVIPAVGGALWAWNPSLVFIGGAVLGGCSLFMTCFMRAHARPHA
jgi:hypothetical protein